eukprot:CAMPEP_0174377868 /NCGR_PEP_ID=MMETSP0811_2-20130205/121703_1 /TAXON_ID=73025 ORGANISM="Eutreptiella gymnastica-like, Strain CCMP1594" /NCGR_SAMPLE_ID=MMETSP0811_2 /ASSEMBLY_ACC=CAM_ASM_000667 /LENGTH=138 /DNA_ID=CAMNT_0015529961 /DNA_START=1446 /DNA_END=1863 /DNA_ORIENTATION=-
MSPLPADVRASLRTASPIIHMPTPSARTGTKRHTPVRMTEGTDAYRALLVPDPRSRATKGDQPRPPVQRSFIRCNAMRPLSCARGQGPSPPARSMGAEKAMAPRERRAHTGPRRGTYCATPTVVPWCCTGKGGVGQCL